MGEGSLASRRNKVYHFLEEMPVLSVGLNQRKWRIKHVFSDCSLKKERAGFRGSQGSFRETRSCSYDLWRLCAPTPVCLANTCSSFKTAQMTSLGGPAAPCGSCSLCPLWFSALCAELSQISLITFYTVICLHIWIQFHKLLLQQC